MQIMDMKRDAWKKLASHYGFFFILFLPIFILELISGMIQKNMAGGLFSPEASYKMILSMTPFSILSGLISTGIMFICIDAIRNKDNFNKPFIKSTIVFSNAKYFWGTIFIGILNIIWTALWSILFIIPGIIKGLAYSQSIYIYRDAIDKNEPISYVQSITLSRHLMNGHKWDLFLLQLSFIGWYILIGISGGIAGIWVIPYLRLTLANFYQNLLNQNNQ